MSFLKFFHKKNRLDNIIHCCTEKTASQWFQKLLSDDVILRKTNFGVVKHAKLFQEYIKGSRSEDEFYDFSRNLYERHNPLLNELSGKNVYTSLYMSFDSVKKIIDPTTNYRLFFILRDPRDIMVSVYFSMKFSHPIRNQAADQARKYLSENELEEGIIWCIDTTVEKSKLFEGQKNWIRANLDTKREQIFRYEHFTDDYHSFMVQFFDFLQLGLSGLEQQNLIDKYRFENFSNRKRDMEDVTSHYRSGAVDQWKEYFTPKIINHFKLKTGDLVEELGYQW